MELILVVGCALVGALLYLAWRLKRHSDALERALAELQSRSARTLDELSQLADRFAALERTTSDGIIQVDAAGMVVDINDTARTLLGVQDPIGHPLTEIAWGYDLRPLVDQVLAEKGTIQSQTIIKGERALSVRAVSFGNGEARSALIGLTEVTELQRLGKVRREFVANISHELRTPVTSLQLIADTIQPDILDNKALVTELMERVRLQIDVLKQLTDELLDLALIESGQAPIRLVETPASDLVAEALAPMLPQAERKHLAIETDVPGDIIVLADPQATRKVLSNLTHNAIKFTPPNGKILVRARMSDDLADVEFSVQDTGIGIPSQDLPRIFERFYKVDRSRVRARDDLRGTGLGLAIAKHIVEAHGGRIWAESVEGHGTTIHFTLPAASSSWSAPSHRPAEPARPFAPE